MAKIKTNANRDAKLAPDMHLAVVNAGREGYRRAGMAHAKGRVAHPPGTFTAAQIAQLQNDPKIVVMQTDPPEQDPPGAE